LERVVDRWIWLPEVYPRYKKVVPGSGIKVYAADKIEPVKNLNIEVDIYIPTGRYSPTLGYEHEYKGTSNEQD